MKAIYGALLLSLSCLASGPISAQEAPARGLNSGYARVVSFATEPEIAAASYTVDNNSPMLGDLEITAMDPKLGPIFELAVLNSSLNRQWSMGMLKGFKSKAPSGQLL